MSKMKTVKTKVKIYLYKMNKVNTIIESLYYLCSLRE
jgi:hypothetical protein